MAKSTRHAAKKIIFETRVPSINAMPLIDYLKEAAPFSGRGLRKYFFKGLVILNNRRAHSTALVKSGDAVVVFEDTAANQSLEPENIHLDIIYEDQELLVIDKPAGLLVHPVKDIISGTLANGVAAYFRKIGLNTKIRPVNRLDSGTSGLIIFAKSAPVQDSLSEAIQQHLIQRIYYAVVKGIPRNDEGTINAPIAENRGRRFVSAAGQSAETHFRIVAKFNDACLLELNLKTGRTHQIRVHLRHLGCPIIGDGHYGVISKHINRPALHAGKLDFSASNFNIPQLIAPVPDDIRKLLDEIKTIT